MAINGQTRMEEILSDISSKGIKPKLMLHSCCAPCSSYVLELLRGYFDITVYYYNPNIEPEEEYEKRALEQKKFVQTLNESGTIGFLKAEYNPADFESAVKGYEGEKEGGERCFRCYALRMRKTAEFARIQGFDYFTTTLSISPYKNAEKLNEIGAQVSEETGVPYLYADFKKKEGYKRSIALSKIFGLYRQDYCGCRFSKQDGSLMKG